VNEILLWGGLFIISLAILIKSSDYFTDSAEKIGLWMGLPAFIIGVTIVALGTSLPELISSVIAVLGGSSEIVAGNVVGSNIANIFLVLGIAAIVSKKMKISFELIHVDLPLIVASAFILVVTMWDGVFNIWEGLIGLAALVVYVSYTVRSEKKHPDVKKSAKKLKKHLKKEHHPFEWKSFIVLAVSAFFIFIGAKYTIESVIKLSEIFNIGKELIAISAVALGTSLPELIVSISAARRGKAEIAVGNVLGSNIFNSFAVMGIPAFISPLIVPKSILMFGLPVMVMATLLYFFMTQDREITQYEGWLLVLFYVLFVGKLFNLF